MIQFEAKTLAAVAIAQSTYSTNPILRGVLFEGSRAIATNGHFMTVGSDRLSTIADAGSGVFPISKKAITAMKKRKSFAVIINQGELKISDVYGSYFYVEDCKEVDGAYLDWRNVIPHHDLLKSGTESAFTNLVLDHIIRTSKILSSTDPKGGYAIKFFSPFDKGMTNPNVVRYCSDDVFSLAKPCSSDSIAPFPDWFTERGQEVKQ